MKTFLSTHTKKVPELALSVRGSSGIIYEEIRDLIPLR